MNSKSRVTLFFPGKKQTSIGKHLGYVTRLPLSLLTIAPCVLREGYTIRIVDNRLNKPWPDNFDDDIMVGVTSKTGFEVDDAWNFAKYVKSKNVQTPVVWGGVHASILPEVTLKSPFVDFVVRGPGEEVIVQLLQTIADNVDCGHVCGLSYKRNERIVHNGEPRQVELDNLQLPAYDLIDLSEYANISKNFDYESSRGCPFRCEFCYNISMGEYRRWRGKSAAKVVTELETIVAKYAPDNIEFVDDYFFVDVKRVGQICDGILSHGLKFRWSASCRIDQFSSFTDEYIDRLARSGVRSLCFGAESHSDNVLRILNKFYRFEQAEAVIEKCKQHNIIPIFNYIVGVPGETKADVDLTVNRINLLKTQFKKLEVSAVSIYVPFPGSSLYSRALQLGLKESLRI